MTHPANNARIAEKNRQLIGNEKEIFLEKEGAADRDQAQPPAIKQSDDARGELARLREELAETKKQLEEAQKEIAYRDEIGQEHMTVYSALIRLSRSLAGKLGMSEDERKKEYDEIILGLAKENPVRVAPLILKATKKRLGLI